MGWFIMTKSSGAANKRAKKKHQKEVERKANRAQRRAATFAMGRPRTYATGRSSGQQDDLSIGVYAARIDVPFFHAAFALSYPDFSAPRDVTHGWSLARVERLDTESIVAELHSLGIAVDREVFRQETATYRSAITFATEVWFGRLSSSADARARDVVRLAAHVLWTRWNEDRPSREMAVNALLHMGWCRNNDEVQGIVTWGLRFWEFAAPELTPDIRTLDALEERLDGGPRVIVMNHIADLADVAEEVAVENPDLGRRMVAMFDAFGRQFSDESVEWHQNRIEETARVLRAIGEKEQAETMARELMTLHPQCVGGYLVLAECWMYGDDADKRRAIALLEEAEALPVKDAREYDLDRRIERLCRVLERKESGETGTTTRKSTQRLVRLMKLAYEYVHDDVIQEIGARGDEAVGFLKNVLADPWVWKVPAYDDGATLRNAFRALGAVGTDLARQTLREIIAQHRDVALPEEAVEALEKCARNAGSDVTE